MTDFLKTFALLGLMLAAPPVLAQENEDPAAGLDMGQAVGEENAVGQLYVREVHEDWEVRCVRTETENEPCQINQTLRGPDNTAVAEISLFPLPEGQPAAAGATIVVPLMTLLTEQLTLSVDGAEAKRYNFTWCDPEGCFARIGLTADDVAAFKRGAGATISIVPVTAPEQRVTVPMSLTGFTDAFDAVNPN